jgi:predicted RNase H-like nuclease (RuvC/YqgF family)
MKGKVNMTDQECIVILGREVARLTAENTRLTEEADALEASVAHLLSELTALRAVHRDLDKAYLTMTKWEATGLEMNAIQAKRIEELEWEIRRLTTPERNLK